MSFQRAMLRSIRIVSAVLSVLLLVIAASRWWSFESGNTDRVQRAAASTRGILEAAGQNIDGNLKQVVASVDALATSLSNNVSPGETRIAEQLRVLLYSDSGYLEAGVAYAPFEVAHNLRLFGLSLRMTPKGIETQDLDAIHDYARAMPEWYRAPMAGSTHWSEPVYDEVTRTIRVTYSTPIYRAEDLHKKTPVGVAFAVIDATVFDRILSRLDLGANGYAYLVSTQGKYFVHPNQEVIGRDVPPFSGEHRSTELGGRSSQVISGQEGFVRIVDADTGMVGTDLSTTIDTSNWTLGAMLFDEDFQANSVEARRAIIQTRLLLGAAIFLAAVAIVGIDGSGNAHLWTLSWIFSVICVAGYWLVVQASIATSGIQPNGQLIITQHHSLDVFKAERIHRSLANQGQLPYFIPTGIYIRSMNFVGPADLRVTGLVWQRYTTKVHDAVERGFVLPESATFEIEEAYLHRVGNEEIIGWNFKTTLSEALEYSGYPFGRETVSIQLWHRQFYKNVVLVPDLDGYKDLRSGVRPGVAHGLTVLGWDVERTFFGFVDQSYATDFGLRDYASHSTFPELFFNIQLNKQIVSPFVANILPLSVVLILLFALLVLGASRQQKQKSGIALDAVAAAAGLFLLVIFSHINLRANLAAREIFYLEYYYFLVYMVILGVTVNYLLFTKTNMKLVQYKSNLIAKIIYWPLTQLTILLFTLAEFY